MMMKTTSRSATCGALTALSLLVPLRAALASGFALRETDAMSVGSAFIGGVSRANDASTVVLNPAGMSFLDHSELENNLFYADPNARFRGQNFMGPGVTTSGVQGNRGITDAATGAAYGVWKINSRWAVGYGFYTPYGQRANYPQNWVGRYQSLVTSITDYELSFMASYRVTKRLSIGAGPRLGYLAGRFTQAVNLGPINTIFGDTTGDLTANAFAFGYDVGAIYKVDDATQIGVNYQSRMSYNMSSRTKFSPPPALAAISSINNLLIAESGHGSLQVTLPDSVSFGITRVLSPRWTLMLEGQWTHWSLIQSLNNISDHGGANTTVPVGWRNTWFGGISATYKVSNAILLRGGVSYDESPATLASRNTRTPDTNRFDLGFGVDYRPFDRVTVTLGYAHIFGTNPHIDNSASNMSGRIVGVYNDYANVVVIGTHLRF
ncbi:OmpP1/FadL family transporter [Acidomonas methanolica]|uniref:OmpP1/FadL family transporter n=1 Tax=Acidomonas methanolica TaxID=437 RepID=UPI00211A303D|nr:OmpP1/FadL family transporter [Acidomonas methanolica]MCQ9154221.1 transporter [Acidomonas methanolica]